MKKFVTGVIALAIATALYWAVHNSANGADQKCNEFEHNDIVTIIDGPDEGAQGLVFEAKETPKGCMYEVRYQHGIEMPMLDWFESWELDNGDDDFNR